MWTLHNPPNVVTEPLPNDGKGMQMYTRRMRRRSDPPPQYIKDWDRWARYCDIYGTPHDLLNEDQVRLMRMGLPRNANGSICSNCHEKLIMYKETDLPQRYHSTRSTQSFQLRAPTCSHNPCAELIYLASFNRLYLRRNQERAGSGAPLHWRTIKTILSSWL